MLSVREALKHGKTLVQPYTMTSAEELLRFAFNCMMTNEGQSHCFYCKPTGKADSDVREEFLTKRSARVARKHAGDQLLIGMDSNSSIGTMYREEREIMTAVGPHGIKHSTRLYTFRLRAVRRELKSTVADAKNK